MSGFCGGFAWAKCRSLSPACGTLQVVLPANYTRGSCFNTSRQEYLYVYLSPARRPFSSDIGRQTNNVCSIAGDVGALGGRDDRSGPAGSDRLDPKAARRIVVDAPFRRLPRRRMG